MSDHARLAPSGAERWGTCPASVSRCEDLESVDSPDSLRGTAAHLLLEYALKGLMVLEDQTAPDMGMFKLNAEDVAAVKEAYKYLMGLDAPVASEAKVNIGIHFGREDCWGTLDSRIMHAAMGMLEIADYKHGMGVVEPFENKQLLLYALGAVLELPADQRPGMVRLTIMQPRAPHDQGRIRSWDLSTQDLLNRWGSYFKAAMELTDAAVPIAKATPEACKWCLAKATCPDVAEQSLAAAQAIFAPYQRQDLEHDLQDNVAREPGDLTPEQIVYVMEHEKMIRGWLDAVKLYAYEYVEKGGALQGFKMVAGPGSRFWKEDDETTMAALRKLAKADNKRLGKADITVEKLLSPAQTENQIKPLVGDKTWETIEAMVGRKNGKPALVPLSDSRKAIPTSAAEVFGDLPESHWFDVNRLTFKKAPKPVKIATKRTRGAGKPAPRK